LLQTYDRLNPQVESRTSVVGKTPARGAGAVLPVNEKRVVDHVEPRKYSMQDGPSDRFIHVKGDCHCQGGTESHALPADLLNNNPAHIRTPLVLKEWRAPSSPIFSV